MNSADQKIPGFSVPQGLSSSVPGGEKPGFSFLKGGGVMESAIYKAVGLFDDHIRDEL